MVHGKNLHVVLSVVPCTQLYVFLELLSKICLCSRHTIYDILHESLLKTANELRLIPLIGDPVCLVSDFGDLFDSSSMILLEEDCNLEAGNIPAGIAGKLCLRFRHSCSLNFAIFCWWELKREYPRVICRLCINHFTISEYFAILVHYSLY